MLESFNLMNLGSSVDNSATFAVSSSSAALNGTNAEQSALFHQATTLSFNEHLANSINESQQQQQSTSSGNEASKLAMQIVKLLLEQNGRSDKAQSEKGQSEATDSESQIAGADAELLDEQTDIENGDVSSELLATIDKFISELPAQQRSQFEFVVSEIKSLLADEINIDSPQLSEPEQSLFTKGDEQASIQMLSELKAVIGQQLEALNVIKQTNQQNSDLTQLIDSLQAINKQLADIDLSNGDDAAHLSQQMKQLMKQLEQFAGNNRELAQAVNPLHEKIDATIAKFSEQQIADIDSESIASTQVAIAQLADKEKAAIDKLATIISQLSSEERRHFNQIVSQENQPLKVKKDSTVVADVQTAKQMLAQIEQSRASLQPVAQAEVAEEKQAQVTEEKKVTHMANSEFSGTKQILTQVEQSKASLQSAVQSEVSEEQKIQMSGEKNVAGDLKLSKASIENEKGVNVKTSDAINIEEPVKLEGEANAPKGASNKVDALVSQLEASFRNKSTSNTPADTQAASVTRVEQQVAKEVNASQVTAQKAPENMAQRITLNDNSLASQQIKEHMTMMMRGGVGHAVLNLDPEELGAMSVRIVMQQDQMNVQFQVSNSQAKDMLEQAMAKLKESLQEQGIALNQSDVKEQNQQQKDSQGAEEYSGFGEQTDLDEGEQPPITLVLNKQSTNGIDYYA